MGENAEQAGNRIPEHVAIIMDGNGRWAKTKGMPRIMGHREGVKTVRKIMLAAKAIGIKYLTLYAFSTENWKRPQDEVDGLMKLFSEYIRKERKSLDKNNARLIFSGRKSGLSEELLKEMDEVTSFLSKNTGITMNIAVNYGGRQEIVDAVQKLLSLNMEVNEENISKCLYQPNIPDPELVIRTSGEYRTSNFLTWESVYSEFYIFDRYWPDFTEKDLKNAVESYGKRDRRFGGVK